MLLDLIEQLLAVKQVITSWNSANKIHGFVTTVIIPAFQSRPVSDTIFIAFIVVWFPVQPISVIHGTAVAPFITWLKRSRHSA